MELKFYKGKNQITFLNFLQLLTNTLVQKCKNLKIYFLLTNLGNQHWLKKRASSLRLLALSPLKLRYAIVYRVIKLY